jgi:signal transduction histidine kinase/PAS domain-containing protein
MVSFTHDIEDYDDIRPPRASSGGAMLPMALNALSDGVAVFDGSHRLIYANECYRRILGDRDGSIQMGATATDIIGNLSGSGRIVRAERNDVDGRGTTEWLMYDGRKIRFVAQSFLDGSRMSIATDITNAVIDQEPAVAVAEDSSTPASSSARRDWHALGAAADALGIGAVVLNTSGVPELFNRSYQSFLEELECTIRTRVAESTFSIRPIPGSVRRWRGEANDKDSGEAPRSEHAAGLQADHVQKGQTLDGRTIRYVVQPLDEGKLLCLGVDISAEQAHEREKERLEAAESACGIQPHVLAFAKDMRIALNTVVSSTYMMLNDALDQLSARQRQYMDSIFKVSGHSLDLVERVLDYHKITSGQAEIRRAPVNVAEVVRESLTMFGSRARACDITLHDECLCDEETMVMTERDRLLQILANFLGSAARKTRPGGHIWVTCAMRIPGWCWIDVRHTGNGVLSRRCDGAAQPSGQAGPNADDLENAGLGLVISKDLVERMGGRMGYGTEPDGRSAVWLEFPVAMLPGTRDS